ncbi:MAG: ABC transporter permease [Alphaproteobacteria bacterium]|nr:ABC transporter permease [Alphaproteobacteria bacterium]
MSVSSVPVLQPRKLGPVNWLGLGTLIQKEIERFLKIYVQTLVAPIVSTLLFYSVFVFGARQPGGTAEEFTQFLVPGLILITMAQNAFMDTSASLVLSKLQGNIVDILMTPLSAFELAVGYSVSGIVRGLLTGTLLIGCFSFFVDLKFYDVFYILYFAAAGSAMLSLLGLITGIWADKFDHVVTIQTFIVTPATFLSGAFYTIDSLPEKWRFLCYVNPLFYITDGFRYGFTGQGDMAMEIAIAFALAVDLGLLGAAYCLFDKGYKLKA